MANQTFSSILDRPSNAAEPPPTMPQGSYIAVVTGLYETGKSAKKQTPFVKFPLNLISALDDVDPEELVKAGGVAGKKMHDTYYLTDDAEYRLRKFLDDCGVAEADDQGNAYSHRERMDATPNCQVGITIKHTASEDGTKVFANISGTFKPE